MRGLQEQTLRQGNKGHADLRCVPEWLSQDLHRTDLDLTCRTRVVCCSACLVPGTRIDLFVKFGRTRQGKRSRSAIVRSINEKSHLKKVELEVEGLPGTDSYDLTQVAWKLPAHDEHHVFSVDVSGKTVILSLSEPKSFKAVLKIKDDSIRERGRMATADEWNGLQETGVYKLVKRPSGSKCIPIVWVLKIKAPKLGEQLGRFKD